MTHSSNLLPVSSPGTALSALISAHDSYARVCTTAYALRELGAAMVNGQHAASAYLAVQRDHGEQPLAGLADPRMVSVLHDARRESAAMYG